MGRGGGFYDRLLAGIAGAKCGVAFDQQIVPQIPAERHDVNMNFILTPTRWLEFSGPASPARMNSIVAGAVILVIGILGGYLLRLWRDRSLRAGVEQQIKDILDKARLEAESLTREARLAANEEALKVRTESERLAAARQKEIAADEQRLSTREELVNGQLENLVKQEKVLRADREALQGKAAELEALREQAAQLVAQRRAGLAEAAKMSESEVRAAFLKQVEQESMGDAMQLSQHIIEDAKCRAEEQARKIISLAIQRYAGQHSFETSTATVNIKGEEMKGRIIGREGRNIRAFEAATGVTVLIDDTPGAVVLSGFDPVRRQIAREAMERLILDGRIHPARIEEVVGQSFPGNGPIHPARRRGGGHETGPGAHAWRIDQAAGPPPFPPQLRPEYSPALRRGGPIDGLDGRGIAPGHCHRQAGRPPARHRQSR